jgi:hypothetical protein
MMKMNTTHTWERRGTPQHPQSSNVAREAAHIYDEGEHHAHTGAPQHTVAPPKWQFGVRAAHTYDESEHHAHTGAPRDSTPDLR